MPGRVRIRGVSGDAAAGLRTCSSELVDLVAQGLPLWVACTWDERPPPGLAGRCDGELRGVLSRLLSSNRLDLAPGEATLVGAAQRFGGAALLVLGAGRRAALSSAQARELGRAAAERAWGLGRGPYGVEPVWAPQAPELTHAFVEAHLAHRRALGARRAPAPTWILPPGLELVVDRPGRAGGRRRWDALRARRRQRSRVILLNRSRKK